MAPVLLSLQVALLATLIAGSLAIAVAGLLTHVPWRARALLDALLTSPLVLPPSVLGYYLLVLVGRHTVVGTAWEAVTGGPLVFSRSGAVVAACVTAFPFVLQGALGALESVDPLLLDAARTLGAGRVRTFVRVTLPLAARGVAAGVVLGFARSLGDFGTTLMVAGNVPGQTQTASLFIYDEVLAGHADRAQPMVLTMTVLAVGLMVAARALGARAQGGRR
jgi:molybdate transport system permease protein